MSNPACCGHPAGHHRRIGRVTFCTDCTCYASKPDPHPNAGQIELKVHRAQDTGNGVPAALISIGDAIPRMSGADGPTRSEALVKHDATMLADTLWRCLPGGTLDQLQAILLARRASSLVVPFQQRATTVSFSFRSTKKKRQK